MRLSTIRRYAVRAEAAAAVAAAQREAPPALVVFGLGNHSHPNTRHSLGQNLAEGMAQLAAREAGLEGSKPFAWTNEKSLRGYTYSLPWSAPPECFGDLPDGHPAGKPVQSSILFVKSKIAMNGNGSTAERLRMMLPGMLRENRLLVLHDDVELPQLAHECKFAGAPKGHNGLKSVQGGFRTSHYHRVRIGIGRPEHLPLDTKRRKPLTMEDFVLEQPAGTMLRACRVDGDITRHAWDYALGLINQDRRDMAAKSKAKKERDSQQAASRQQQQQQQHSDPDTPLDSPVAHSSVRS